MRRHAFFVAFFSVFPGFSQFLVARSSFFESISCLAEEGRQFLHVSKTYLAFQDQSFPRNARYHRITAPCIEQRSAKQRPSFVGIDHWGQGWVFLILQDKDKACHQIILQKFPV